MFGLLRETRSGTRNPSPLPAGAPASRRAHKRGCSAPSWPLWTCRRALVSTCGLLCSSPTWESAHSLNERAKKKNILQMPTRSGRPDLHGCSLFWDRDSAPTCCAVCSCWPEAGGTDVPPEPCASDGLRPSLFPLPLLLSSSFLLPEPFSFFLHFSPAFLSLPSSFLFLAFFMPYHLRRLTSVPVIEGGG